ncbi:MAG: BatA protein [Candidatus Magnetoglobus multicellularis str. Araruama]|uniref:BatA protein n=1 Tax=Candidatus Magnetoglobus multicellularis str. Araruama TaxID=890399 RepID=A0A1V1P2V0_9BACT|nr:MAG: BatA protein [Candidatus Magnetoglobus multicellularis str. Araruama]
MFRLAYPYVLTLFIPLCLWGYLLLRKRRRNTMTFSLTSQLKKLSGKTEELIIDLPVYLRLLCMALLILTICRPQSYNVSREIKSPGVDILLCMDTSGSMQALDFKLGKESVNRLTAVKKVVSDFVKKRENDRIGLVVFGEHAFTQAPLTMDKGLLLSLIDRMEIGMAGDKTAIGSALAIAGKRIKDIPAKAKIVILLTDGRNNAGDVSPTQAAEALDALEIKIYTIGVGGKGEAPFKVQGFFGEKIIYQKVDLDETTLRKIANTGNGRYFRAADTEELSEIYDIIDREEKTEVKVKEFFHYKELYGYFLIPSIILLLLEIFIQAFVVRSIP